jgi:hypothetical protein
MAHGAAPYSKKPLALHFSVETEPDSGVHGSAMTSVKLRRHSSRDRLGFAQRGDLQE